MRAFRDWSLRTKMTVLVVGTCCIALVCASVVFIQYESESTKRQMVQELSTMARIVADNSSAAVLFNSPADARGILNALSAKPDVLLGEVYTSDGRLFAHYVGDTVGMNLHRLIPSPEGHISHEDHVHVWEPITVDGDSLGIVHLLAGLDALDEHIANIARTTGIAVFMSLLLSLVFSAQIQRIIVRPILELADLAERVSTENDYSVRATEYGKDEVGVLVNQFNTMLTRIQLTSRALQDAHDHLELRVQERTQDLETEIGERKQREIELRNSRALLQEEKEERHKLAVAIEQSPEAIVIAASNGAIEYINPAFERIFGMARDAVLYKNMMLLCSDEHDDANYDNIWQTIRDDHVWSGTLRRRTGSDQLQILEATISPIRNDQGLITNVAAVYRDVTSEIELENRLRQSQKLEAVGSLAAGIAHEINTPIQFIGDNLQFMKTSFDDVLTLLQAAQEMADHITGESSSDVATLYHNLAQSVDIEFLRDEVPHAIGQTQDGVQRVSSIVQAMKQFSHPDQGDNMTATNLNDALTNTLTVARNELKYVSDVVTELQPDLPMVACHPGELNQVFLNILINAAHAIGEVVGDQKGGKGTITVRSRRDGDDVVIEIADTGKGVPPDIRDRIFDPFFTTKGVGRGTGQGLAIARSIIVDKHGGALHFETELGQGTTFYIRLPIELGACETQSTPKATPLEVQ